MTNVATAMTVLGQFRGACRDLVQGAARACNGAFEVCYQHPWSTKSHALAVAFLPAFIGDLLGDDGVAHSRDLVSQLAMQALAMGCLLALCLKLCVVWWPGTLCCFFQTSFIFLPPFLMRPCAS